MSTGDFFNVSFSISKETRNSENVQSKWLICDKKVIHHEFQSILFLQKLQ